VDTASASDAALPPEVVRAYDLEGAAVSTISIGLINRTLLVQRGPSGHRGGERLVLQRLHPIFGAEVNLDIDAVTTHIASRGLATPRIVRTEEGKLWVTASDGVWRAQSFVEGRVTTTVESESVAEQAGRIAARFHLAASDLTHTFDFTRPGAHDTAAHLRHLESALESHQNHPRYEDVRPVARHILQLSASATPLPTRPLRIVHGDLKISNVLFDENLERALALVDLDTLAHGTLGIEMGDALRSWCNPAGEDEPHSEIDAQLFEAALGGYSAIAAEWVTREETDSFVPSLKTITLELAARFCRDALEETYFGWNAQRFASRGEHNLVRARSQLCLAESITSRQRELEAIVART